MSQNQGKPSAQGRQVSCSSRDPAIPSDPDMEDQANVNQGFRLSWATEQEVDLSDILATRDEINAGYHRRIVGVTVTEYYNRTALVTFPGSLTLNRSTEEPPYPRCMQRAVTWRRIMSCMAPEDRPDYFLTNREEALEEGYSNVTWKIGNLCVQVVAVTNAKSLSVQPNDQIFISAEYKPLSEDDLLQLRVIGHKNLCVLGLLLFLKYLDHAWNLTYHQFMGRNIFRKFLTIFVVTVSWLCTLKCAIY